MVVSNIFWILIYPDPWGDDPIDQIWWAEHIFQVGLKTPTSQLRSFTPVPSHFFSVNECLLWKNREIYWWSTWQNSNNLAAYRQGYGCYGVTQPFPIWRVGSPYNPVCVQLRQKHVVLPGNFGLVESCMIDRTRHSYCSRESLITYTYTFWCPQPSPNISGT